MLFLWCVGHRWRQGRTASRALTIGLAAADSVGDCPAATSAAGAVTLWRRDISKATSPGPERP